MTRIVIFANGEVPDIRRAAGLIRPTDRIVCADGGSQYALALELQPEVVIGDLDSLQEADRRKILATGTPLRQYSRDKDQTDLELALQYAIEQHASEILIVGALGRRLDQTLANVAMLTASALASLDVQFDDGLEQVLCCRKHARIEGAPGDLISLIPWGEAAEGVRTEGLRWPLRAETLHPEHSRGVSNEMLAETAEIGVTAGLLLVVHRRQASANGDPASP